MAGEWQREFFLITEDPFFLDQDLFQMWLDGKTVDEATKERAVLLNRPIFWNFLDEKPEVMDAYELMFKDTAQQYEAYEALEGQLGEPAKFLEFCPVQMQRCMREEAIRRFYALNGVIIREHVILITAHNNRLCFPTCVRQHPDNTEDLANTAKAHNRVICHKTQLPPFQVARTTANIQRVLKWLEDWRPLVTDVHYIPDEPTKSAWESLCDILTPTVAGQYFRAAFFIVHRFDIQSSRDIRMSTWSRIDDVLDVLFTSRCLPVPDHLSEDHQLLKHYDNNDALFNEVYRILKLRFETFRSSVKQGMEAMTGQSVSDWSPQPCAVMRESDSADELPHKGQSDIATPEHPAECAEGTTLLQAPPPHSGENLWPSGSPGPGVDTDMRSKVAGRQRPWASKEPTSMRKAGTLAKATMAALGSLTTIRRAQGFLAQISDMEKNFLTLFDVIVKATDVTLSKDPKEDPATTARLREVAVRYLTLIRDSMIAFHRNTAISLP